MSEYILRAEGICYEYQDGTNALNGIDLNMRKGERLAVMGSNGSGKSTFFLCLNGVYRPRSGKIYFEDDPVQYSSKGLLALRRKVGIVFQDPDHQLFSADVFGEISFGAMNLGLSEEEVRRRVGRVMEELNITSLADKPVHFLSGGQKKLISIADVLVMEPDVVILDEPSAALDPWHARMVDEIIDGLSAKGITVIISTHDVDRALRWADSVVLFDKGRVLAKDVPQRIFADSTLLRQTNLERPSILTLFGALQEKGILPANLSAPRSEEELTGYIRAYA